MQDRERVGRKRAVQIYKGLDGLEETARKQHATHFKIESKGEKRQINPWVLQKAIDQQTGAKPKRIRSNNNHYIIEATDEEQSTKTVTIKKINDIEVNISEYTMFNTSQGMMHIYIYEYDVCDFEEFKAQLIAEYGLQEVIRTSWINLKKPDSNTATHNV